MEAIKFVLQLWGPLWASSTVRVFTDNTTFALDLLKQTLKSPANTSLRQTLLLAATHDIIIEPSWIERLRIHWQMLFPLLQSLTCVLIIGRTSLFQPLNRIPGLVSHLNSPQMSHDALNFLWNGLSADTRAGYNSAVKSSVPKLDSKPGPRRSNR
jgi:hypothetical protein